MSPEPRTQGDLEIEHGNKTPFKTNQEFTGEWDQIKVDVRGMTFHEMAKVIKKALEEAHRPPSR